MNKKPYQKPAITAVIPTIHRPLLNGSGYKVNEFKNGGSTTLGGDEEDNGAPKRWGEW